MTNIEETIINEENKENINPWVKYNGKYKEYQKGYQKEYYHKNIKGKKKICECGLSHDIFRIKEHLNTKKHQKLMNLKNEIN